jgi:hypothetical protein
VILGTQLVATPGELVLRLDWCDDTDTYDARTTLVLSWPTRRTFTRELPPRIRPGRTLLRFGRGPSGQAADLAPARYRYRVAVVDLDGNRTLSRERSVAVPPAPSAQPVERAPSAPAPETSSTTCDPNYEGACIPPSPTDLDCDEVGSSDFASIGSDPHGFDGDGDGVACES